MPVSSMSTEMAIVRSSFVPEPLKSSISCDAHAILLSQLFDEMYPQYGGKFSQVIDNYDPRAEPSLLTCGDYDLSCVRRAHRTCHFDPGRRPVCT